MSRADSSLDTDTEPQDVRTVGQRLSNWGRWGADDERGTVNLITPQRLIAAGGLIRQGKVFSLGIPLDENGPQDGKRRANPVHLMSETGGDHAFPGGFCYSDDFIMMSLQSSSQWDALAHVHYDGQLYNGFPASGITVKGAAHCSIDKQAAGIAGRGVLLDIAALHGVDWLDGGTVITPEDLDAACQAQGVEVGAGDILLFRTGWRTKFLADGDSAAFMDSEPGLGQRCCAWLHERDVAAVGSDNWAIEVLPSETPDLLNLHMILIRDMGMSLCEILDLDALAEDCRADGCWEFFFVAPPLPVSRAVGSPVNPLAIK